MDTRNKKEMKTLLTILVLTVSVNLCGQRIITDTANHEFYQADYLFKLQTVVRILPILNEYKQDCYNDSTWTHTYLPSWSSGCFRQEGNLAYGYEFVLDCDDSTHYEWTHKEPTFADFIEWLNKY